MNTEPIGLILAGGSSNRFWPLAWSKPLMPVAGKTVLEQTCLRLLGLGLKKVVIVTNLRDEATIQRMSIPGMSIQICVQQDSGGMAGAALAASELVSGLPCIILNAPDIVDDRLYTEMKLKIKDNSPFIVGKKVEDYIDVGYLELNGDMVTGIQEKPGAGNEPSKYIELVYNYFHDPSEFFKILKQTKSDKDDVYEQALTEFVTRYPTEILRYDGFWQPLKYPWQTLDFMKFYLSSIKSTDSSELKKSNVSIEGQVYLGNGVKIFENAKIVGPCYIGNNVIIGNNCIVRESQIGDGCVIGFNSDVTRSYLGSNCWLHSNYVGDSVLCDNVSLGSGAILANLRLDEENIWSVINGTRVNTYRTKLGAMIGENVRIGVQTSIMPGIKIGHDSFIGAGITLDKDITDESFCMLKPGHFEITKNKKSIAGKSRDSYKNLLQ